MTEILHQKERFLEQLKIMYRLKVLVVETQTANMANFELVHEVK